MGFRKYGQKNIHPDSVPILKTFIPHFDWIPDFSEITEMGGSNIEKWVDPDWEKLCTFSTLYNLCNV